MNTKEINWKEYIGYFMGGFFTAPIVRIIRNGFEPSHFAWSLIFGIIFGLIFIGIVKVLNIHIRRKNQRLLDG